MSTDTPNPSMSAPEQSGAPKQNHGQGMRGVPWYVLSRVGGAAIAFATVMLFARLLGPSGYGLFAITTAAGLTANTVVFGWINYSYSRFFMASDDQKMGGGSAYGLLVIALALLATVVGIAVLVAPDRFVTIILLAGGYAACWGLMELSITGMRVRGRARQYAMSVLGRTLLSSTLGATFALMGGGGAGALLGIIIGALFVGLIVSPGNLGKGERLSIPSRAQLETYVKFGGPLAMTAAGAMFAGLAIHGVVVHHLDLAAAGYFAAAENLSQRSIRMLMLAINLGVSVEIFRAYENGGAIAARNVLERHAALLGLVSLPILAVMVFASDLVSLAAFGPEFAPTVAPLLSWHAIAAVLGGFQASYLSFTFLLSKRTWPQLVIFFVMLAVSVGLAWVLVPQMGVIGGSVAVTIAWAVSSAAYVLFGAQAVAIPFPLRPITRMVIALAPSAALMIVANNMPNIWAGLVVLGLSLLLLPVTLFVFDYPDFRRYVTKMRRVIPGARPHAQKPAA